MSLFDIRRPYPGRNISIIVPSAIKDANDKVVRGKPLMRDLTDGTLAALAAGQLLGFVTREVVDGGPSVIDRAQVFPGRLELPFALDQECSVELADAVECEGSDYVLTSGTGALSTSTSLGAELSFFDGKFYEAQSGDEILFKLADRNGSGGSLTEETSGNVRILAERIV